LLIAFAADRAALRETVPVFAELFTTRAFFGVACEALDAFFEVFPPPFILDIFPPGVGTAASKLFIRPATINSAFSDT
jgi:hypothetical protein